MIPKKFKPEGGPRIFALRYATGGVDYVIGVRVRRGSHGSAVLEVEYPFGHGSGIGIGRIVAESESSITFIVSGPHSPFLKRVTIDRTESSGHDLGLT